MVRGGFSTGKVGIQRSIIRRLSCSTFETALYSRSSQLRNGECDFQWRKIDWCALAEDYESHRENSKEEEESWQKNMKVSSFTELRSVLSPFPSPVELNMIDNRRILIKRDDLLRLEGSNVSGNKARKMFVLSEMIEPEDFPEAIVSYGGPQSNAMVALAAIVASKSSQSLKSGGTSKRFIYYVKKLPRYLRKQPNGNLLRAKTLGMELIELSNDRYNELFGGPNGGSIQPPAELEPPVSKSVWIPQGGACESAIAGAKRLAKEISTFWNINGEGPLGVVVPSGTGTTALCLQRELNILRGRNSHNIDVIAIPCVGTLYYFKVYCA